MLLLFCGFWKKKFWRNLENLSLARARNLQNFRTVEALQLYKNLSLNYLLQTFKSINENQS